MATVDYKDLNIRYKGHPKYSTNKVVEDKLIEVIIQKLEMILFTRKGEVLGQPNLGCDIEYYLWSTNIPANRLKNIINEQIIEFIPEMTNLKYNINVDMYEGTVKDILEISIEILDYNVNFIFQ